HADEPLQQLWFPAYGLLPRWHHARPGPGEKPAGLETLTLTFYPGFCAFYLVTTVVKNILGQTYTLGIKIIRRIESLIGIIRFK
ncbi:hypothetical protein ONK27_29020, partial [Salmonella enterica subsp. enterica serovar Virginia]|nr:hypothetical protein [Salmonella enterica subsp. enterica serovar Virginia]